MKTAPNFGTKTETTEDHLGEGGPSRPVQAVKTTHLNVDIMVKSGTMKKSDERRSMSRLPQADYPPITPPTPTMKTMAECL